MCVLVSTGEYVGYYPKSSMADTLGRVYEENGAGTIHSGGTADGMVGGRRGGW